MMAKTTTAACLKCSCAQQRTVRKLFKDAFMRHSSDGTNATVSSEPRGDPGHRARTGQQ